MPNALRGLLQLKAALVEAFVKCDELLTTQPRMVVTERVQDGNSQFEVSQTPTIG